MTTCTPAEQGRRLPEAPHSASPLPVAYIARHGETESNLARRYAGRNSEPLTAVGREQIRVLAHALATVGIHAIWTSQIARAVESADLISCELRIPFSRDARLDEMLLGPWEGLTEVEVAQRYRSEFDRWNSTPDQLAIEGRETLEALARRVMGALQEAFSQREPVLLVTHVAPMRVAALRVLGLDLNLYKQLDVSNAACFSVNQDRAEVLRFPDRRSLLDELHKQPSGELRRC